MGVLPAGTANVFAQELGLPRMDWAHWFGVEETAAKLARGQIRLVDLGNVNRKPFLLWAGVGLDGKVVNSIEPRDRWEKTFGVLNYAILTLWTSLDWTGLELRVTSGERTWEGRFLVAVASNIRSYAGGLMELAPSALVDDGQLDFWLISWRLDGGRRRTRRAGAARHARRLARRGPFPGGRSDVRVRLPAARCTSMVSRRRSARWPTFRRASERCACSFPRE